MQQPPMKTSNKLILTRLLPIVGLTILSLVLLFFVTQLTYGVNWVFYKVNNVDSRYFSLIIGTFLLSIDFFIVVGFFINFRWPLTVGKWLISLIIAWVIFYGIIINIVPYPPLYYQPIINAFDRLKSDYITKIELRIPLSRKGSYDYTEEGSKLILTINDPVQIKNFFELVNIRETEWKLGSPDWDYGCPNSCYTGDFRIFLYYGRGYAQTFDIFPNFITIITSGPLGFPNTYSKQFSNDEMTKLKQLIGISTEPKT